MVARVPSHGAFRSVPRGESPAMAQPNFIQAQKFLDGVDYPADRDTLVDHAREHGADAAIVEALSSLDDREYGDPTEVSEALAER
jgi:hypothetical protein